MEGTESLSSSPSQPELAPSAFIQYLAKVCTQPGPRSRLRRTLGRKPEDAFEAHAIVAPFLGDEPSPSRENAMYCVAALFARFGGETQPPNRMPLGRWLGNAVKGSWDLESFNLSRTSIERRLYRVARMSSAQVRRELPLLLSATRVERTSLDWDQLIKDLTYWDQDRAIAKRWLQGFHQALGAPPTGVSGPEMSLESLSSQELSSPS